MKKLTRREVIKYSGLGGAALLAACAPAQAPAPAAPAAEPAKPAEAVKPTEAPAAPAGAVKPPIPFPDAPPLDLGGAAGKRQPISEIVTYKALDAYSEAPVLAKAVADGKLPPVKDRLPKEPLVVLSSGMKDGPGEYGDLWRGFSACPTAGWNNFAGTTAGWYGIESYSTNHACLVKTGPLYRSEQDIEPFPNTAKSWEWSADGLSLTMHLIEGAKWSDGQPFTADDVLFTWEGYVMDANVNAGRKLDAYKYGDKDTTLEKVDDYTIKFTFGAPKPMSVFYNINESLLIEPAHTLKPLHPKWSTKDPKPSYKDFENALPPDKLPVPVMGPWVPTEYKTDELLIMRRNPYFWQVDEKGQQLPYFDEVQYKKGPTGIGRDLCTMAGDCDHTNLENPSSYVNAMAKAQEGDAKFSINWGPELLGFAVEFNFAEELGTADDRDKAVRQLNRNVKFRQALSYATDRDGIAQAIMRGPLTRGYAGGIFPGSPSFDQKSVVYFPYDVESAKILLDEIGLKDTDNDGVREWSDGSQKGQPVVIQLLNSEDQAEAKSVAEALVNQWAAVGIKVNARTMNSAALREINDSANWDTRIYRAEQQFALPFTRPTLLAPLTANYGSHREGSTPRKLMDFEVELIDIVKKYRDTFDGAERNKLMSQYNNIFTKNVYHMGVFSSHHGLGLAKRVKNIPPGTTTFFYTWVEDAIMLQQMWTPKADQFEQNRPDSIPEYKG
jgi:peptide/nickel transport system substrate-binding protein